MGFICYNYFYVLSHEVSHMTFLEYLAEELKYYDEHPEEQDPLEAHSNCSTIEIDYTVQS